MNAAKLRRPAANDNYSYFENRKYYCHERLMVVFSFIAWYRFSRYNNSTVVFGTAVFGVAKLQFTLSHVSFKGILFNCYRSFQHEGRISKYGL